MMAMKWLLGALVAYGAIVAILALAQTSMLFPAGAVGRGAPLPPSAERLTLRASSGETLVGTLLPARPGSDPLVVIGFGGNAWNADTAAVLLHEIYPEANVIAFHYRGYAPSEGRPSAAALAEDAVAVFDLARSRFGNARIVAAGFSIGSGAAASVAAERDIDGLILVTPFDSLAALGAGH